MYEGSTPDVASNGRFFNPEAGRDARRCSGKVVRPRGVAVFCENNHLACPTAKTSPAENIDVFPPLSMVENECPIGGTTGLRHQSSEAIGQAAAWYVGNADYCERPLIPALRRRFGLTPHEAVTALRDAGRMLSAI